MERYKRNMDTWNTGGAKCSEHMGHCRISASRSFFRCTSFVTIAEEDASSAFLFRALGAAAGFVMALKVSKAVATTK